MFLGSPLPLWNNGIDISVHFLWQQLTVLMASRLSCFVDCCFHARRQWCCKGFIKHGALRSTSPPPHQESWPPCEWIPPHSELVDPSLRLLIPLRACWSLSEHVDPSLSLLIHLWACWSTSIAALLSKIRVVKSRLQSVLEFVYALPKQQLHPQTISETVEDRFQAVRELSRKM